MSTSTYEQLLREALVDLSEMQELDSRAVGRKTGAKKADDHQYFLQHWTALYLRYVQIARKLDSCHDQVLQPQKRQDARVLLDSCIGRMLEMKQKIVEYCGEYVNLDEALVDLKLTPDALEIPIPKYFVEERRDEMAARRKFVESLFTLHQVNPADYEPKEAIVEPPMTLERAIDILQCNERGRQGRMRAKFLRSIYEQEQHQAKDFEYGGAMDKEDAAKSIQKIVRGFLARKKVEFMMKEELEFLGMEPSDKIASNYQKEKLARTMNERKMKQQGNLAELGQEAKDMRARIKMQEGGRTMEEMLDEVLLHMANLRLMAKEDVLPEFPTEEEGGSLALLGMLPNQQSAEEEAKKKAEEEAAAAKKPAQKETKKTDKELEEEALPTIQPSMFWDRFSQARDRYVSTWHTHFQKSYLEQKDFEQRFDKEILRQEILHGPGGVMAELRKCVDQLVMVEVVNLRERMMRERGMKTKKGKNKNKKNNKRKNVKDPTEGKKMEEHMSRLVSFGVLQLPQQVQLEDYVGAPNMMGSVIDEYDRVQAAQQDEIKQKWQTLINNWNEYVESSLKMDKAQFEAHFKNFCEQSNWSYEPSMQQVRQSVAEYCVLPLGSQIVHDLAPHPQAVLLYGAAKSGKTMLTHAVCAEAGANFFSLSPAVLNKEGLSLPKLVQATFRVARALAPSVVYLDEVEKVFMGGKGKKKKKGEAGAGKSAKIKKDLVQQMKELDATDRVLVIGNSRSPWDAEFKEISAFFKRMICCVNPDYASRLLLWQNRCKQRGATLKDDEYEVLAYMSNRYSSGTIMKIVDETLTARRVKRIGQRPPKADEFLPALARAQPVFKDDYEQMKEFSAKLPLDNRRAKYPEDFVQEEPEDDKKKQKPKPKK